MGAPLGWTNIPLQISKHFATDSICFCNGFHNIPFRSHNASQRISKHSAADFATPCCGFHKMLLRIWQYFSSPAYSSRPGPKRLRARCSCDCSVAGNSRLQLLFFVVFMFLFSLCDHPQLLECVLQGALELKAAHGVSRLRGLIKMHMGLTRTLGSR